MASRDRRSRKTLMPQLTEANRNSGCAMNVNAPIGYARATRGGVAVGPGGGVAAGRRSGAAVSGPFGAAAGVQRGGVAIRP